MVIKISLNQSGWKDISSPLNQVVLPPTCSVVNQQFPTSISWTPAIGLQNDTRGQIFSQWPTSLQTHNFLIPYWEGTFIKKFLVTSNLGMSL
jgi:hypothetical protein